MESFFSTSPHFIVKIFECPVTSTCAFLIRFPPILCNICLLYSTETPLRIPVTYSYSNSKIICQFYFFSVTHIPVKS